MKPLVPQESQSVSNLIVLYSFYGMNVRRVHVSFDRMVMCSYCMIKDLSIHGNKLLLSDLLVNRSFGWVLHKGKIFPQLIDITLHN